MDNLKAIFPESHERIKKAVEDFAKGREYSYQRRILKQFNRFVVYTAQQFGCLTESNINFALTDFRNHCYTNRGSNNIISADTDYRSFANLMRNLSGRSLPNLVIPKSLPANLEILKKWDKQSCLGYINPKFWKEELANQDQPKLSAIPTHEYLEHFIEHQRKYVNNITDLARAYISEALTRFENGRGYISQTSEADFADPDMLHNYKSKHNGQRFSLFSDQLPENEGLKNLVGFIHHKLDGLLIRDFPGSNNHLYRFGGRTFLSEHLGLSSDLAAACAVVIIAETGINPESLYKIKLSGQHQKVNSIIIPTDGGKGYYIEYYKPRAGGYLRKLVARDSANKINAEFCFQLVASMTKDLRAKANTNQLFIHDSTHKSGCVQAVSNTAFKAAFKRLINKSQDVDLIASYPNLSKLRVSCGILAWYGNGGDPRAASRFLGNTPSVALKHYIPAELQELLYSKQIRAFQDLLIAVATSDTDYQQIAVGIRSTDDFLEYLSNTVETSSLHKFLTTPETALPTAPMNKLTFVLSEANIALLYNAKSLFETSHCDATQNQLKDWHDFAVIVFKFIQSNNNRKYQAIMRRGIKKAQTTPVNIMELL